MSMDKDCIFCSMIAKQEAYSLVFEDELLLAILTIRPMHTGHTLLIPKEHVADISHLNEFSRNHLFKVATELKSVITSALICQGFNFLLNQGEATRALPHLHLHLIPRSLEQPIDFNQRPGELSREQLDVVAAKIRQHLSINIERLD